MSTQNGSANFSKRALTCFGYFLVIASAMLFIPVALPQAMQSNDGTLDATFGAAGQVKTDFSGHFEFLRGLVIQPDGKSIIAAQTYDSSGAIGLALVRYNRDGSLDDSFGSGGKVFNNASRIAAAAIALLPDGKILVGGTAQATGQGFAVTRFNGDGSLDTTFGSGGTVFSNLAQAETGFDLKVQADGKILVAGIVRRGSLQSASFAVLRFKSQGGVDKSFGNGGKASVEFSSGFDFAFAMALQPDGKIVLAGGTNANNHTSPWGLARFNSDGSPDSSFGSGGKVTTNFFSSRQSTANAVVIQPDGKIIAAGITERDEQGLLPHVLSIARYQSDGSLDTTFGSDGKATYDFAGRGGVAFALALQRDGKILAAGAVGNLNAVSLHVDFAVVRYNKDGSFDSSFGDNGIALTDLGDEIDQANAMALQPDGKIVLGGYSGNEFENRGDIVLARYNNDSLAFDNCIQDDSNGNLLQFNSVTGDYKFTVCATGFTLSGKAVIKVKGCKTKIQATAADHSLAVTIKTCKGNASATIEVPSPAQTFTIADSHTADNDCVCH